MVAYASRQSDLSIILVMFEVFDEESCVDGVENSFYLIAERSPFVGEH